MQANTISEARYRNGTVVTRFREPGGATTVSIQPELALVLDRRCAQLHVPRAEYVGNLVIDEIAPRATEVLTKTYEELLQIIGILTPDNVDIGSYRAPDPRANNRPNMFVRLLVGTSMAILSCEDLEKFAGELRVIARSSGCAELKSVPKGFATLLARRQGSGIVIELECIERHRQSCATIAARNVELIARLFEYAVALARITREEGREPL